MFGFIFTVAAIAGLGLFAHKVGDRLTINVRVALAFVATLLLVWLQSSFWVGLMTAALAALAVNLLSRKDAS